ncbi:MAG: 50S ribosomal protein L10 [Anaerolineae bacterium]
MTISREQKAEIVEDLKERLGNTDVIILTDYRGLSVPQQQALRSKLRDITTEFRVAKNTLTKIALKETNRPVPEEYLTGPTALTLLPPDDIAGPTKALLDFAKQSDMLIIKGGIVGDRIIGADEVKTLADLPPREVLLAQLIAAIQGPAANLVRTLQAPAGDFVSTLQAPMREMAMTIQAYADQQQ